MAKKAPRKIKKSVTKHKPRNYLLMYFLAVFAGLATYLAGSAIQVFQSPCANARTCQSDRSVQIDNNATGTFEGHTVIPPRVDLNDITGPSVLGTDTSAADQHIYVDLSAQKLFAFQGTEKVIETFIASGKWNPTPVGNFHIWTKLRATRMSGGEGADYYNLPNVPYVMYFYNDYGLHGAYWHNNFGHKMSHGCVNMRIVDARDVYNWAHVGTAVSVCKSFTEPNNCEQ